MPNLSRSSKGRLSLDSEVISLTATKRDSTFVERLTPAGRLLSRCIQCGTCSASCPSAPAMDLTPRQMWRLVQLGFQDQVLHSQAMWLCSLCYTCHVRCPRGIPLTETIVTLKRLAIQTGIGEWPDSTAFYQAFSHVMRRYGRMREMEFMIRYFLATNLLSAAGYAKLGLTLLRRGKVHPQLPRLRGEGRLDRLFERVAELEGQG